MGVQLAVTTNAPAVAYEFRPDASAAGGMLDMRVRCAGDQKISLTPAQGKVVAATAPLEAARLRAVRDLGEVFRERCAALVGAKSFAYFENWLWASRAEMTCAGAVPVLPLHAPGSAAQADLARKLEHRGLSCAAAAKVCAALQARAASLSAELAALEAAPAAAGSAAVAVTALVHPPPGRAAGARWLSLACDGIAVSVEEAQLQKLWALYAAHAQARPAGRKKRARGGEEEEEEQGDDGGQPAPPRAAEAPPPPPPAFFEAAFCVCARLLSLQGGSELAGGMQAACPRGVFEALRADLGVRMELFASPLNCRLPRFCSAAADVDAPFGSRGSFFDCKLRAGAFLANPPFDPGCVQRMAARMEQLLGAADAAGAQLTFVVVMPRWQMPRGPHLGVWRSVHESPHATARMMLPKARHAYLDGGLRPSPARHDSSVIVLQSAKAARRAPFTEAMQARLSEAFLG